MGAVAGGDFGNTAGKNRSVLDAISHTLAGLSLIPGVDTFADLAAIPIDVLRGDWISAGLNAIGAIPFVDEIADTANIARKTNNVINADKTAKKKIDLPENASQIKYIFGERNGHLANTPSNRRLSTDTANNPKHYRGTDKFGNYWHMQIDNKGGRVRTRSQNEKISEGGRNCTLRQWDKDTGLSQNPTPEETYKLCI